MIGKAGTLLGKLMRRYPLLLPVEKDIEAAAVMLEECYRRGGKLLIAGNGGSACDAQHIAAELMKGFMETRPLPEAEREKLRRLDPERGDYLGRKLQRALPAVALGEHDALNSAFANDVDGKLCFAQQVNGYGRPGDVFLGISTSGNSENILFAALTAKAKGMRVIGFTGESGGALAPLADLCVRMPAETCHEVQELQLPVYHCWCRMLELSFFGEQDGTYG